MIEVKFFGTARVKFQVRSIEVEANDVKELISVVAERFCIREKEVKTVSDLRQRREYRVAENVQNKIERRR